MNTLFGTLLTSAFLVGVAYSLDCHTCTDKPSNEYCVMSPTQCDSAARFCYTEVTTVNGKKNINKKCAADCPSTGNKDFEECCKINLCNKNGANGVKVSVMLLSVAVGASALMLRAGL